jgi:hypothetical protein
VGACWSLPSLLVCFPVFFVFVSLLCLFERVFVCPFVCLFVCLFICLLLCSFFVLLCVCVFAARYSRGLRLAVVERD